MVGGLLGKLDLRAGRQWKGAMEAGYHFCIIPQ
jgi:hypothetical protein